MSATMAIKLIKRNAHVSFKLIARAMIRWKASGRESKKQYGNQLFHFLPLLNRWTHPFFLAWIEPNTTVSFVHTSSVPTLQQFTLGYPQGDRGGNEICVRVAEAGQPMDLHRFWDGVITSSQNLTRLRNEATALRNRQEFQRSQLTELAKTDFESWAKESFEIATKIAYRNGGRIGVPKGGAMDCTTVAGAPMLPVGYVVSASRIADRRMILAGYRLADLLTRILKL
jgi:S1/P1 Nuclease